MTKKKKYRRYSPEFTLDFHVLVVLANTSFTGMVIIGVVQQGTTYKYVPRLEGLHGRFTCHGLSLPSKYDL